MTIRTIPNFLMLDPADLGYPMSHERRMRAMLGRPDGWVLPDYGVGFGGEAIDGRCSQARLPAEALMIFEDD